MAVKDATTPIHPSTLAVLRFFEFKHLPPHLQNIARPFALLARDMASKLEGPELTVGLRKILEGKDCMVRAALPDQIPSFLENDPEPTDEEKAIMAQTEPHLQ